MTTGQTEYLLTQRQTESARGLDSNYLVESICIEGDSQYIYDGGLSEPEKLAGP